MPSVLVRVYGSYRASCSPACLVRRSVPFHRPRLAGAMIRIAPDAGKAGVPATGCATDAFAGAGSRHHGDPGRAPSCRSSPTRAAGSRRKPSAKPATSCSTGFVQPSLLRQQCERPGPRYWTTGVARRRASDGQKGTAGARPGLRPHPAAQPPAPGRLIALIEPEYFAEVGLPRSLATPRAGAANCRSGVSARAAADAPTVSPARASRHHAACARPRRLGRRGKPPAPAQRPSGKRRA
jgi:hypothetical protein